MMTKIIGEPTPYLIHCRYDPEFGSCGASTYLTKRQYDSQMMNPDSTWRCPQCGCYNAIWDDANYENFKR